MSKIKQLFQDSAARFHQPRICLHTLRLCSSGMQSLYREAECFFVRPATPRRAGT